MTEKKNRKAKKVPTSRKRAGKKKQPQKRNTGTWRLNARNTSTFPAAPAKSSGRILAISSRQALHRLRIWKPPSNASFSRKTMALRKLTTLVLSQMPRMISQHRRTWSDGRPGSQMASDPRSSIRLEAHRQQ